MTGLISREDLILTLPQMVWLAFAAWAWLTAANLRRWIPLFLLGSLAVFWGDMLCFDTRVAWNQLVRFDGRLMSLQEMAYLNHLKFQPPLWNWFLAAWPGYASQQCFAAGVSGLMFGACGDLYGEQRTRRIGACPLVALMCTQPMNGVYALACVLLGRAAWRRGWRMVAVGWVLLGCSLTYTAYALLPLLALEFGFGWSLAILGGLGAYWLAFWQSESLVCVRQTAFLGQMFSLGATRLADHGQVSRIVRRNVDRLPRLWRSGPAMVFYAWPLVGKMSLTVAGLGLLMLIGGGNVKYLILLVGVLPDGRDAEITN